MAFFWQVFFSDRKVSRHRRPSSLRVPPLTPAFALRYAHISGSESQVDSESEAVSNGGEGLEAAVEGDRAWWSAGSIAVPSSETGDNPGGRGQAGERMRVLLLGRLAFQGRVDGPQD